MAVPLFSSESKRLAITWLSVLLVETALFGCGDNATRLPPSHGIRMNPRKSLYFEIVEHRCFLILTSTYETAKIELCAVFDNLSLSTFIRRAIHNVKIEKTVIVAGGGEETLTAVSTLLAQCSKVGTNLNQLARHFNSGGADTEQIRAKLLDELADLTAFRLNAEKVLGELYGNAQAYRL